MDRPKLEVADVFRRYGEAYREQHGASMSTGQRRVMTAIEVCRTATLGGHMERCDECGHERNAFNSCRDRHCPKCQSLARARWIEDRKAELLEVPYFHVVFTVPEEIAAIALQNKEVVYRILFGATAETLKTIAADPKHLGAEIGFFAVLHSWGQNLLFHPHLHCVVPGGGPSPDGDRWVYCRPDFFLPVRVLSSLFRRLFLESLEKTSDAGKLRFFGTLEPLQNRSTFRRHLAPLKERDWVVYAKAPFAGPEQVLDYVGRYTHRVAISNNRLLDIENCQVRFRWKDYRRSDQVKTMTLSAEEFIRRFLLHVLPNGFRRIRYYGFLGNRGREEKLAVCRRLLGMQVAENAIPEPPAETDYRDRYEDLTGHSLRQCPQCRKGNMLVVRILPRLYAKISGRHRFIMIRSSDSELATNGSGSSSTAGEVCRFRAFSAPPPPIRPVIPPLAGQPHFKRPLARPFRACTQRAYSLPETYRTIQDP
jgi:Putative transposase/Transposase zinc-binding domain